MADPVSLSMMSIASSAGGGLLSAFGASSEGKSQKAMYDYQSSVARLNARIDRQNAEWELDKGELEAGQYGLKAAQQFGAIRTGQAASNLDVNSGSNKDVQDSQRKIIQMDNATIRSNAAKQAYDYSVRAVMDENQATMYTAAGVNAQKAGNIKALSSIIGSAGSVASKWSAGTQSGLFAGSGTGPIKLFGPDQTVVGYA